MKTLRLIIVACTFIFCGSFVSVAQEKMTPETLWKFIRVSEPRISPDGKVVLFSSKKYNLEDNKGKTDFFLVPNAGGPAQQITVEATGANHGRWTPDGKRIIYLAKGSGGKVSLFGMNANGGEQKQLTGLGSDITDFGFSPGGDKLWYTMEVKTGKSTADLYPDLSLAKGAHIYEELMFRHWDTWSDENSSHIFIAGYTNGSVSTDAIDIMNKEPYDSPLMPFGDEEQISWSPDGKKIAYTCRKQNGTEMAISTNSEVYLYDASTGQTKNLSAGNPGYDSKPAFSPDGQTIIWLSMPTAKYEADRNRIVQYNLASGIKTDLTSGYDYTPDSPVWSADGKQIYFTAGINATDQVWVYDFTAKPESRIRQLTKDVADVISFSISSQGKSTNMVTCVMSISMPAELFTVDLKTGFSKQLTFVNKDQLSKLKLGKVEKRMVKATDGKDILTWVIYPPDFDPSKKYPTLLYCQGGPQSTVSQFFSYRWNFQLMAANGYIIVAPNRRGLPSFGEAWNRQISGDWAGQPMKDLLSAIDDVSKEPYVNKDKLGAVGASFGGYSVYWLAGNHNKRFKAFIAHCGVFDLESMYGTTEEVFFADFDLGGPYYMVPKPKSYADANPINFVNNWDTPILVIHNEQDFRVPINQGMEAFTAARLHHVPARFLSFPDENHWVTKPQNGVLWQREFFGWLDKYLK